MNPWRTLTTILSTSGVIALPLLSISNGALLTAASPAGNERHVGVVWEDQVDVGVFDEVGGAVASNGPLVFAVGTGFNPASGLDWLARAYDAKSGRLVWADQFDRGGRNDWARGVEVQGSRVFVSGYSSDSTGNRDIAVRAYDSATGAVLWSAFVDVGRRDESRVNTLAVEGNHVFVGGFGGNTLGDADMVVVALDADTGERLWMDVANLGASDLVERLAVSGDRLFAVGRAQIYGLFHMAVRAYDVGTGALLWSDIHPSGVDLEPVTAALATDGGQVYAGYAGGDQFDFIVRAYDARSGAVQWEDVADKGGDKRGSGARRTTVRCRPGRTWLRLPPGSKQLRSDGSRVRHEAWNADLGTDVRRRWR